MDNYSDNAQKVYQRLYLKEGETIEQCHIRVAKYLANTDDEFRDFKRVLDEQKFRINTPCMSNAGVKENSNLCACYILDLEDSMESIINMWGICARIYEGGGGAGIPITNLREKDAIISTGGKASGPLSYLEVIQAISDQVKSGGLNRRAANLVSFKYNHPDTQKIIKCKSDKKSFSAINLSMLVDDLFMTNIEDGLTCFDIISPKNNELVGQTRFQYLWNKIIQNAWETGDPGLLFYDRINQDNPFREEKDIICSNPCFPGYVKVWTLYGAKTFKELAKSGEDIPVLSQNSNGQIEIKMMRNPRQTSVEKHNLIRIHLDNGGWLDCTPDHKWYVRIKSGLKKVRAKNLKQNDSISSLYRQKANQHNRKRLNNGIETPLQHHVHVSWKEGRRPNYPSEHCHHIDNDPSNDDPENLQIIPSRIHNAMGMYGESNPMYGIWDKRNPLYKDDFRGANNPRYYHHITKSMIVDLREKGCSNKQICEKLKCSDRVIYSRLGNNHKVIHVEPITNTEFVYNGTVDDNHNYFVHIGDDDAVLVANCGEVTGLPWTSCDLGHINLNKYLIIEDRLIYFDWEQLKQDIPTYVLLLNRVIDKTGHPAPEFKEYMEKYRPIGLGIMGLADILIKLEIPYGSDMAQRLIKEVMHCVTTHAFKSSKNLANEVDISTRIHPSDFMSSDKFVEFIQKYIPGFNNSSFIANSTVTCIAPTGSTSISADCSYGMEPLFALVWTKQLENGEKWFFKYPYFEHVCKEKGIELDEDLLNKIIENKGSIKGLNEFPEYMQKIFITAHDVNWKERINMQAAAQEHTTMSISSTVNLPNSATKEDISDIYKYAWKKKLKGITVYRDGCLENQPVNFGGKEPEIKEEVRVIKKRPDIRHGKTVEINCPSGKLYITGNYWDDKLQEVFISMSNQDTRTNHLLNSYGRLLSRSLQCGVSIKSLLDTMRGGGGEVFWANHSSLEHGVKTSGLVDVLALIIDSVFLTSHNKVEDYKGDDERECIGLKGYLDRCPQCGKNTLRRDIACRGGSCIDPDCLYSNCS